MLLLRAPPTIEAIADQGWQLTLYMGDWFDYSIPFRAALAEILALISERKNAFLELPPFFDNEDFVEGVIRTEGVDVRTYYEFSLGYLALMSERLETLNWLSEIINPIVKVQSTG